MDRVALLLALILLELEYANELAELAGNITPIGSARSRFTAEQIHAGIEGWDSG